MREITRFCQYHAFYLKLDRPTIKSVGLMTLDHLLCVYLTSQLKVVNAVMLMHSTRNNTIIILLLPTVYLACNFADLGDLEVHTLSCKLH